jgi:hypothetical protein
MQSSKFEKLRLINSQKRLLGKLISIDSRFSNCIITDVNIDYQELVNASGKYLVRSVVANGSKVGNIDELLLSFEILIKRYIGKYGSSIFKAIIPFDNDYFEISMELNVLSDNYNNFVDTFFKIDSNTSEEILIYKKNWQAGLCLFREEHRYYISIW